MGRDLCEEERGWCYRETVGGGYCRTTVYFESKEAALEPLEGAYPPDLIKMLRKTGHVSSFIMGTTKDGKKTMYACGIKIDNIMEEKGLGFSGLDCLNDPDAGEE
jgi:hypothetical protein